jgi:hypothetical protein
MEILFWISVTLFVIALISVVSVVRKHNKMFEGEDPVPYDDMPAQYEDYEGCFYNPEM